MTSTPTASPRSLASGWPMPFADCEGWWPARRQWWYIIGFFVVWHLLGLAVSVFTGNFDPNPNNDHRPFMWDVLRQGYPDPRHSHVPPLYSYYMALQWAVTAALGLPYWTAKVFMDVFLVIATGVLAVILGGMLTRNRLLAIASGVCMVGAPIFLLGVAESLAVILFQPVFLALLVLIVRELQRPEGPRLGWFALAGLLTGIATLIRGNTQFVILVIAPFTLWVTARSRVPRWLLRSVAVLAAFIAMQGLAMAPWSAAQRRADMEGLMPFTGVYRAYYAGVRRHPGNRVSDWLREHYKEPKRSMEGVLAFNAEWLRRDPAALVELYALKYVRAWYMSDSRRWDTATLVLHFPIWVLAIAGLVMWIRRCPYDPAWIFLAGLIFYLWSISAAMDGIARYSSPMYVFLGTLAGVALLTAMRSRRERETGRAPAGPSSPAG